MSGIAVPTPSTVSTGGFLTSALWNGQVRDSVSFLTDPPRFIGYQTSAQSLGSGTTYTSLNLDSEVLDTEGGHSTSTNTSRYTAVYAGLYQVSYTASFPTNATGNRSIRLVVNGAAITGNGGCVVELPACTGSNSWVGAGAALVYLGVGDYLEMQAWQNSGATLALNTTNTGLSLVWVAKN